MKLTRRLKPLATMRSIVVCAVQQWFNHRASSKGAALAFYTLFSMAPILVLVLAVAGVLLLFGATSVFAELKASLDDIWQEPPLTTGTLWDTVRTRVLSFGMVLVLAFLLMVSLVVSAALALLEHYWNGVWRDAAQILAALNMAISFAVIAVMFGVIFKLLPRVRLSWRDVTIGALGTAALFTLGKYAIGAYIGNSGVADSYGAAGSMIALLLWVYYSAQIFFLGAEFARQYALQAGSLRHRPPVADDAQSGKQRASA